MKAVVVDGKKVCRKCAALFTGLYCPACKKAYAKTNAERIRERQARWKRENAEQLRSYFAAYERENAERISSRRKTKRAANLERARDEERRRSSDRRGRQLANGGGLSRGLAARLLKLQRGKCACCRCDLSLSGYHLDHITPLAGGGAHQDQNIQLLCPPCNRAKSATPPHVFMQRRGYLL